MDHLQMPNLLAKFRFILIFFISTFLVFGCASHDVQQAATLETLPVNNVERMQDQGFEYIAKAILTEEEHASYFDNDLIKLGILPMQLYILNAESEEIYQLKPENIVIIDKNGARKPALSVDQIVEKTKKSYWRTAGWTVLFGVLGAVPSAINVNKTNAKIRSAYSEKVFKGGTLRKGSDAEGLAFFAIPKDSESLDDMELSLVLKGTSITKTIPLQYQLSGGIPKRKSADSGSS